MPSLSFAAALVGFSGLALLILSAMEFRKPLPIAKMTGLTWLLFAVAADSFSASLFIMEKSWHLPNAQKPWLLMNALGGIAFTITVLALLTLVRVVAAKEAEARQQAKSASELRPMEGVWPPPPMEP